MAVFLVVPLIYLVFRFRPYQSTMQGSLQVQLEQRYEYMIYDINAYINQFIHII